MEAIRALVKGCIHKVCVDGNFYGNVHGHAMQIGFLTALALRRSHASVHRHVHMHTDTHEVK